MNRTLQILHLEDSLNDAALVKELLAEHKLDFEIFCVQTQKDFEAALERKDLDLILSDYRLPAFDGVSALALARERRPELPYIFVSGNIGEERAIETLKNGATDYILKDHLLRLVSSIRRAVHEVEMKKEHAQLEAQLRQSQKMELVGRLAGGIAHDFNNMLTVIAGYSEVLMRDLKSEDPVYKGLEEIKKAADKSTALTRQLLAFSRRQVLQPKIIDLNTVLINSNQMIRRLMGDKVELMMNASPNLGLVKVDPGQIEQVVLNLVVNARDAMLEGGKVIIETKNAVMNEAYVLEHPGAKTGEYVLLTVKDNGMGMTPEVQSHVFEPFFTTKEPGKGTGLGLATVFGIVKQSHGYIELISAPGKGTTFEIYLPKVKEKIETKPEVKPSLFPGHGTETILLVEDELGVRTFTRKILEMNGYKVLEAENGEKAIALCESYKDTIHLLLTDSVMPRMSGEDVSKKISALKPSVKVVYFSGYADQQLNERRLLEPDVVFLQKPFTPQVLAGKIREVLDK